MFSSGEIANQAVYSVLIVVAIAAIVVMLFRAFRRRLEKPWPEFLVGIYNIILLLLYLLGMMSQASSEGFGFLPLMSLTLPWSGLAMWWFASHSGLSDHNFSGSSFDPTLLINFVIFNVLAGPANSCDLYFLLKRRRKKVAEDEAWEQARRNR